jgi:hypothetical protein
MKDTGICLGHPIAPHALILGMSIGVAHFMQERGTPPAFAR